MAGNDVDEVFVAVAGIVATAPVATTGIAPTNATGDLAAGWYDHGLTTAAAITRSEPVTSTELIAWQNNTKVRTLVTKAAVRWKCVLMQSSQGNIELFNGTNMVSGKILVDPSREFPHLQLDVDLTDGDRVHREYAPNVQIVERGDQVSVSGDAYGYPVTLESIYDPELTDGTTVGGYSLLFFSEFETIAVPTITTALPSGAAVTQPVRLVGTGFDSTVSITVGGVAAPDFDIISAVEMYVNLPAGSAGSAPIIVTNEGGASSAKAYTRA